MSRREVFLKQNFVGYFVFESAQDLTAALGRPIFGLRRFQLVDEKAVPAARTLQVNDGNQTHRRHKVASAYYRGHERWIYGVLIGIVAEKSVAQIKNNERRDNQQKRFQNGEALQVVPRLEVARKPVDHKAAND